MTSTKYHKLTTKCICIKFYSRLACTHTCTAILHDFKYNKNHFIFLSELKLQVDSFLVPTTKSTTYFFYLFCEVGPTNGETRGRDRNKVNYCICAIGAAWILPVCGEETAQTASWLVYWTTGQGGHAVWSATLWVCECVYVPFFFFFFLRRGDLTEAVVVPDRVITPT